MPANPQEGRAPDEADGADDPIDPVEALADAGDVEGLLSLARAYRAGTADVPKDLARCMVAYRAAAAQGSAEAEYALALFHLTGGVVAQDLEKGAVHLRTAADRGSVSAKIYVANLYELGVYYARDLEKADVFYRSAARAANVKEPPGSPEYELKMADLGSVRHGLLLAGRAKTDEERARWMRKVRAYGYQLRPREEPAPVVAAPVEAPARKTAPAPKGPGAAPVAAAPEEDEFIAEQRAAAEERVRAARERLAKKGTAGRVLGAIVASAVAAGFAFVAMFVLYPRWVLVPDRLHQAIGAAAAVFVLGLIIFALSSGAKKKKSGLG